MFFSSVSNMKISWLFSQARLLIMDEPTQGQDWGHLQRLMDFLCQLNAAGTAVLLISHDYKLVHHYARRILTIEDGRIISR